MGVIAELAFRIASSELPFLGGGLSIHGWCVSRYFFQSYYLKFEVIFLTSIF